MFDFPLAEPSALHSFASSQCEALQNAAYLLGGRPWLRRAQRLIDDLVTTRQITNRTRREAHALLGLLALKHVHDPDRPESAYFAMLDPAMPYVEEICALTAGLTKTLQALPATCGSNLIMEDTH